MEDKGRAQREITVSTEVLLEKTFQTLIDTGSSASIMINKTARYLQQEVRKIKKLNITEWSTEAGNFQTAAIITTEHLILPQFTTKRTF